MDVQSKKSKVSLSNQRKEVAARKSYLEMVRLASWNHENTSSYHLSEVRDWEIQSKKVRP